MDNITHGLVGLSLAAYYQTFLSPQDIATINAVYFGTAIASQSPDFDFITHFYSEKSYLKHHRGITHSLPGIALQSIMISWIVFQFHPNALWMPLLLFTTIANLLHVLLDVLNAYGTRVLLPFTQRAYALDILMVVDPVLILTLFIIWAYGPRIPAIFPYGFIFLLTYIAMRFLLHFRGIDWLRDYYSAKPEGTMTLLPLPFSFIRWDYIFETPTLYYLGRINTRTGKIIQMAIFSRISANHPVILAAAKADSVLTFLRFARHLHMEIFPSEFGYIVLFTDLRYRIKGKGLFAAYARLDTDLNIVSEGLGHPPHIPL